MIQQDAERNKISEYSKKKEQKKIGKWNKFYLSMFMNNKYWVGQ